MTQPGGSVKFQSPKPPQKWRETGYEGHEQAGIYAAAPEGTIYKGFNDNALEMSNRIL